MSLCEKQVPNGNKQQGMALILALLVVVLVTTIAVELSWRFDLTLARSANRWYGVQADAYLEFGEEVAKWALLEDTLQTQKSGNPDIDTVNDIWNTPVDYPLDEGWIRGNLSDAQARFNINSLIDKVPPPEKNKTRQPWEKWTAPQRRFIRLLQTLEIEPDVFIDQATAINITEAVIDYVDGDSEVTGFGGAESDYYARLDPPFIAPNRKIGMISVSELNIVRGMTPAIYQKLLPLVIALPKDVPLNVNTISSELIRTINDKKSFYPLSLEDAAEIYQDRGAGYDDMAIFKSSSAIEQVVGVGAQGGSGSQNNSNLDITGLDVKSSYFLMYAQVSVGEHIREGKALMRRDEGNVVTLRRTDANF